MRVKWLDDGVKLKVETEEDLWYLYEILRKGDVVSGKSTRKVKKREEQEGIRKRIFVRVMVEKVSLEGNFLKILGRIISSSEEIGKGYHSINVFPGDEITLERMLGKAERRILKEAERRKERILLASLDYDSLDMAVLSNGLEHIGGLSVSLPPKHDEHYEEQREKFLREALRRIKEVKKERGIKWCIIGCAGFLSDEVKKMVEDKVVKISHAGRNGLNEIVKRGYVEELYKEDKLSMEMKLVEKLLEEIAKEGKYAYGSEEVKKALDMGAVQTLLLLDMKIKEERDEMEEVLKKAERSRADIVIINSRSEPGMKLKGLGGIGAILRYRI